MATPDERDAADPRLWSVDRAHGRMWRESDRRTLHIDRGDSTAKCSYRILLNSLPGSPGDWLSADAPIGRLSELERDMPELICRRCVPKALVAETDDSEANNG